MLHHLLTGSLEIAPDRPILECDGSWTTAEVHVISEMPSKGPGKVDRELLRMRAITAAPIEQVPFFKNASNDFLRDIIPRLDA